MMDEKIPAGAIHIDQFQAAEPSIQQKPPPGAIPVDEFQTHEEAYGSGTQQAIAGIEGLAKGIAGPLATGAEVALGVKPEDIRGRSEENPWTHGIGEAVGFGGSMLSGVGEGALIGKLGQAVAPAVEGASTISKIASAGIRTGAEMAALQTGDEISKMITQDPNQSIGSAAINVGLSGIMGGAGGAVIGSISPLWKAATEKSGIPKIIDDAKAQFNFRQTNPDVPTAITEELGNRISEMRNLRHNVSSLKGEALSSVMPEMSDKISIQAKNVADSLQKKIDYMRKNPDLFTSGSIKDVESDLEEFKKRALPKVIQGDLEEITPEVSRVAQNEISATPIRVDENPNRKIFPWIRDIDAPSSIVRGETQPIQHEMLNSSPKEAVNMRNIRVEQKTPQQIFDAMNDLRGDLWDYSKGKFGINAPSKGDVGYHLINATKDLASTVKNGLEDTGVWGDAAKVQKQVNASIEKSINSEKLARSKFTVKTLNADGKIDYAVSPDKVTSLVNRSNKGTGNDAIKHVKDYLKYTDELADSINRVHTDYGLEAPIHLTPTPAINHTLENVSSGTKLGNWLYDKGLSNLTGHVAAEGVGAGIGSLVGHPIAGAYLGEKALAPVFTSIAKPLLESATNSEAARGAIDYVAAVMKGDKLLNTTSQNLFKSVAEVIPEHLMPTPEKRERLEKSLDHNSNFENATKIGGNIGHYLPGHAAAAAASGAAAINYLNSLKPKPIKLNPLDKESPIDKSQQAKYHRALDIAQQPLMIIKHVKSGTLQPADLLTINTIYPGLSSKITQKVSEHMINAIHDGHSIPYHQKVSLSLLMGRPLEGTNTQSAMHAIIMSNGQNMPQSQQARMPPKKPTSAALNASQKVNSLYQTPLQARQSHRNSS